MTNLNGAAQTVDKFKNGSLKRVLEDLQQTAVGLDQLTVRDMCSSRAINDQLLSSALMVKRCASQINEVLHSVGILMALPALLEDGEKVISLSLGAGNTGKPYDLETISRIAEFKFIHWQGGTETIRQNSLFKDFYELAECKTNKKRFLYVLDTHYPISFLSKGRAIKSVLSRNVNLWDKFQKQYPSLKTVCEYYTLKKDFVRIEDVGRFLPTMTQMVNDDQPTP